MRGGRWLLVPFAAFGLVPLFGVARTFATALQATNDAQWEQVSAHEQRFIQSMRSGTAAEGDDSSC